MMILILQIMECLDTYTQERQQFLEHYNSEVASTD